MNIEKKLLAFKSKLDPEIKNFFNRAVEEAQKEDKLVAQAVKHVEKIVSSGGKRLRPALMYYGYIASGGKEKREILKVSVSMELVHMFLLIHDDIIDRDNKRHGVDTVNYKYQKLGKKFFDSRKDYEHFGNSMGIIIGDIVGAAGTQIIFTSKFSHDCIMRALFKLQNIIGRTVVGQAQDIFIENKREASQGDILKMHENKTARYTVEGPLHVGACLASAPDKFLDQLSHYALPVGIGFQIQDDILGIFGSEKKLGKPVGSDIEEGKYTLLVVKALENGNSSQKKIVNNLLGKKNLSFSEIIKFRKVIRETGSLEYSQKLARKYVEKGKVELEKIKMEKEAKDFLGELAGYIVERKI